MTGIIILGSATAIATAVGLLWQRRHGSVIATGPATHERAPHHEGLAEAGVLPGHPTVVHFTAVWCGPCAAVRRVIEDTLPEFPEVTHIELDIDEHAQLGRDLSILSLPTTLLFDTHGHQRFRIPGVPTREALSEALVSVSGQQG
ncbi:thioredoxin family protein [Hoyosella sp. G463]|uniref:Thioredoxin family protein n=1 Tax=Lolliginicoccus lacisalsi TaxID=2742202 RepID=A0A927JBJ8_9ACTN|nr:thioredoxin family protein [Lolliginicoccus lacisalsi]MBD8505860.1 thioredoxin family protein [Lolliginicoccus lacisalsi]